MRTTSRTSPHLPSVMCWPMLWNGFGSWREALLTFLGIRGDHIAHFVWHWLKVNVTCIGYSSSFTFSLFGIVNSCEMGNLRFTHPCRERTIFSIKNLLDWRELKNVSRMENYTGLRSRIGSWALAIRQTWTENDTHRYTGTSSLPRYLYKVGRLLFLLPALPTAES